MKKPHLIDRASNRVYTAYGGITTSAEVIETIDAVIADPDFRPGMDAVCDYSDATAVWGLAELDQLRKYVLRQRPKLGHMHWAVVFPKGKDTTTARIFIALHNAFDNQIKVRLFSNLGEAESWLKKVSTC